jgi:gamma-glutamyl phosphate reductase
MIEQMARDAKDASRELRKVGRGKKDAALELTATRLIKRKESIQKENDKDRENHPIHG